MNLELLNEALPLLFKGAQVTLLIGLFGIVLGFPLGIVFALARLSSNRLLSRVTSAYSAFFRGTPMLVQIFILYYGFGQLSFVRESTVVWWLIGSSLHCAMLAVVLNTVAYASEIFRGGFQSVPRGQVEAGLACGMTKWTLLRRVRFPLAIRQALPAYGNEVAIVIKESSLASTITVLEITGYAKRLMSETFAIIEIFAIASCFYLVLNVLALTLVRLMERRLNGAGMARTTHTRI
ncbi:ABC transporter permease [Pseudomonas sp. K2I15]|uniref:ABC transporter permease n=1 Tax=unclassified Pseudomonas TaxID=196821 RepID=UPI000B4D8F50|nr:ABC transporter permease subunit [Pseudomonas sp. K2I15]OWP72108.1 ABC transporter permease [Pseudomonas sp. K2I15]